MNVSTKILLFSCAFISTLLLTLVAGCSGGDSPRFPEVLEIKDGDVVPILANSELVAGQNRLVLGFIDSTGATIVDAKVHLTFYDLNDGEEVEKFQVDAVSRVPARDAGLTEQVSHKHADGTDHAHFNVGENVGVYTAMVNFERPGNWGVEIKLDSANPKIKTTIRPRFNVLPQGPTPPIGAPAPRSRNLTAADVSDIAQIDSSAKPSVEMHTSTIADTIAAGRPSLVLFAVPGFCESRLCGPEMEIMRKLLPQYRNRVEFIHVEFYKNPGSPERVPADPVREWNLRSEPWFFLIDAKGNIAAKFEGPASLQELDEALKAVAP